MIYSGRVHLEMGTSPDFMFLKKVMIGGHTYVVNSYSESVKNGYRGSGHGDYTVFEFDDEEWFTRNFLGIEKCPICGAKPYLVKRNGRKKLMCLNHTEKNHVVINTLCCGNHSTTSVKSAIKLWNKLCFNYKEYGVGLTDWVVEKDVDDKDRECLIVTQCTDDIFGGYRDTVCQIEHRDDADTEGNVARLIAQAPKLRNACDEAKVALGNIMTRISFGSLKPFFTDLEKREVLHALGKLEYALVGLSKENPNNEKGEF